MYKINNGAPIAVTDQGVSLNITFSELTVELDPNSMHKKAYFDGHFSGDASGIFYTEILQELSSEEETTLVDNQTLVMNLSSSVLGVNFNIDMNIRMGFSHPVEWFLDRSDLDSFPIGFIYETGGVDAHLSGQIDTSIPILLSLDSSTIEEFVVSTDKWEIIDKLDSMTVQGKYFTNIVVVKRSTISPSSGISGELFNGNVDMIYWVAKGIGMIKGLGQFDFNGEPLTIELVDSNLL